VAAAEHAVAAGGPTIATAGLATIAGFLVLLLSPVPMVREFGALLVVGIVLAFAVALTAGFAALVLGARREGAAPPAGVAGRASRAATRAGATVGASVRGAGELVIANRAGRAAAGAVRDAGSTTASGFARALRTVTAHPGRTLAVALAAACIGWVADTQTEVVSDVQRLVPQDLQELRDVQALQNATDVSGEIDVVVEGKDLTDPRVVAWMTNYQQRVLKAAGFREGKACTTAKICPALSLPDLFSSTQTKTKKDIEALLDNVPPYFSQAVITPRRDVATLAFGIRLMPFDQQKQVIDRLRSELDPPPGVTARLAGLPVLVAEANAELSSTPRRFLTLGVGLLLVFLVLLAVYRRLESALVPLIPIALATGWSALVLFLLRIPLNPMSATLGALVIAISTEFGVLLAARYRQEREAGHSPEVALDRTYRSTGAAVLASGATAIAGFGVLVLSDVRMLREFGFVTVVDLSVSLLGVLLVLPAVLLLAERGELLTAPRRALGRIPRPRRLPRPRARRAT
jgi:hydrophobe/amphiphile efflux-3 (HAE3) family protein